MIRRIAVILLALAFVTVPAWAGDRPEFDAVGCDATNYFNDNVKQLVIDNGLDGFGNQINNFSAFASETFNTDAGAGQLFPDPCFPNYLSAKTPGGQNLATYYEWRIVLQMMPQSDIDLNIRDCVMKQNMTDPFGKVIRDLAGADQTGWYDSSYGRKFSIFKSPCITVMAVPGATSTWSAFYMKARTIPGLYDMPLKGVPYTSKALWDESIVLKLPKSYDPCLGCGLDAQLDSSPYEHTLKQGDMIDVRIEAPSTNQQDIYYGKDNVVLKYIGVVGTEYDPGINM